MSEGTAVPYVRRYYTSLFQAASGLTGVRVQYSTIYDMNQALGDNGRVECVYWSGVSTIGLELRTMKGTPHVRYREESTSDLVVAIAAKSRDDAMSDTESRAANLLGEVVKVIQTSPSPTSPGSWLHGIACWVEGREMVSGLISSGGDPVYSTAITATVHIQALVEQ